MAERREGREGRAISCCKGCGVCCRQLVPLSAPEAWMIADVVASMPEARRRIVYERFVAAARRLEENGFRERLMQPRETDEELMKMGSDYFMLGIACPFLEDESCSIYADRPIACREYLVCSPAENCRDPMPGNIEGIQVPAQVSHALAALGHSTAPARPWVPFILALEWAEQHPDEGAPKAGTEWLQEFFQHLAAQSKPVR
jgi:Fe-S-cluster containining protein